MTAPDTSGAPRLWAVVGATGTGKTALSLALAEALAARGRPAEIVNTDSMLVYRGMDIGTAKPTPAERGGVPHHLIDLWPVTHTATVAEFQGLARAAVADCRRRGVTPVLVGGSALYVRAVLDRFEFPGTDPAVRAELAERAGVSRPTIARAETGQDISTATLSKIARALQLTVELGPTDR